MRNKLFRLAASTIVAGVMAGVVVTAMPQQALAAGASEHFESFSAGPLNGQGGWKFSGPHDVAIANTADFGVVGMGSKALRISNASTSDAFDDWAWSQELVDDAGELGADGGSYSSGNRQPHFEAN